MMNIIAKFSVLISILMIIGCGGESDKSEDDNSNSEVRNEVIVDNVSGMTITILPRPNLTVAQGANDISVSRIQVTADIDINSFVSVDQLIYKVHSTLEFSENNLPLSSISEVKLYKNSTSDQTLLAQVSGDNIANDGTIIFSDFEGFIIDEGESVILALFISFVDSIDSVNNSDYSMSLISLRGEGDNNNEFSVLNNIIGNSFITVTSNVYIHLYQDNNNDYNLEPKNIIAGSSTKVFSNDIVSYNGLTDVGTVEYTVDTDLTSSVRSASLYLDETLIATNQSSDITDTAIIFNNLNSLIIHESRSELTLELHTESIGVNNAGQAIIGAKILNISLIDIEGYESGEELDNIDLNIIRTSQPFSIIPVEVTPSVELSLDISQIVHLKFTLTSGDNTNPDNFTLPVVRFNELNFQTSTISDLAPYEIYVQGYSDNKIIIEPEVSGLFTLDIDNLNQLFDEINFTTSETLVITRTTYTPGDQVYLSFLGGDYRIVDFDDLSSIPINTNGSLSLGFTRY